jgi:hypothetical protein
MTTDQEITELKKRLETLESEREEKVLPGLEWLRQRFSPTSGYLRTEAIPQLTGDVTHSAGTEPVDVPVTELDRFELMEPVEAVVAVDAGTQTVEVINVNETGTLIGIGIVVSKYTASGGTSDVFIRTNLDGGGNKEMQIVFADRKWGKARQAFVTVGDVPQSGDVDGHAMYIPANLPYGSNLTVSGRVASLTSYTGEYDLAITVHRGRLV